MVQLCCNADRISAHQSTRIAKRLTYPAVDQFHPPRRSVRQSQNEDIRDSRITVESRSQTRIADRNDIDRRFFSFNSNIRQAASPLMFRPQQFIVAAGHPGQLQPMMRKPIIQHVHQPIIRDMPVQRYQSPVVGTGIELHRGGEPPHPNGSPQLGFSPNRIMHSGIQYMNQSQIEPHRIVAAPYPTNIKMYVSDGDQHHRNQTQVQANHKQRNKDKEAKKQYKQRKRYNQ